MRRRVLPALLSLCLAATVAFLAMSDASPASAAAADGDWVEHPGLVPDTPERNYPVILSTPTIFEVNPNCPGGCNAPRETLAVDMIGPYIISGGNFLSIQLPNDGGVVSQPYLAIVDSRDKSLVCTDLDVDDEVLAIAPGPTDNTAIIGGRFNKVTGPDGVQRTRNKLALIDLDTCEVSRTWLIQGGVDGKVTELAVSGNRLFVGGDFENFGATTIGHLAEISLDTAAINTTFDPNFENELTRAVVAMEASPDGTRLAIVHRATRIMGDNMRGSAIFDISDPNNITLTDHEMEPNTGVGGGAGVPYNNYYDIQDGAISPDFSTIVIVQGTATVSDYVTALPTVEDFTFQTWQHYMRDSSFGVAATNDIVYVTGHFCKIDPGPGATDLMAPNSGPSECTGADDGRFGPGVWRTQMAALDIDNGTPLTWNPGSDAFVGGRAATIVDRGLLVGFDGTRSDNILTGTTAFFDFGAPPDPREDQACSASVNGATVDLSWDEIEGVSSYVVRRNTKWVASPGDVDSYTDTPPAGTHTYFIRTTLDGIQWDTQCDPTVVVEAATQSCTAQLNADRSVTLTWDAIPGEDSYVVRRNGSYVATAGNVLEFVDTPSQGIYTYVIRSKLNGITRNTTCSPEVTVPAATQTCVATVDDDGVVTLSWSALPGEDTYVVRRNGGFLASAGDALSYVEAPGEGIFTYVIRSRNGGATTNTTCEPEITIIDDTPAQTCAIVDNGDGTVSLTWTAIEGEDLYQVRRNNAWIESVTGVLEFTATGHQDGDSYVIRSKLDGVQTDTACD